MNTEARKFKLSFCELSFYDHYVISEINEGAYVTKELFMEVLLLLEEIYSGCQKYVYISNRKADYNVNPIDYLNCISQENMIGVALVTSTESKKKTALFEKNFMSKKVELFSNLQDAVNWANSLVE